MTPEEEAEMAAVEDRLRRYVFGQLIDRRDSPAVQSIEAMVRQAVSDAVKAELREVREQLNTNARALNEHAHELHRLGNLLKRTKGAGGLFKSAEPRSDEPDDGVDDPSEAPPLRIPVDRDYGRRGFNWNSLIVWLGGALLIIALIWGVIQLNSGRDQAAEEDPARVELRDRGEEGGTARTQEQLRELGWAALLQRHSGDPRAAAAEQTLTERLCFGVGATECTLANASATAQFERKRALQAAINLAAEEYDCRVGDQLAVDGDVGAGTATRALAVAACVAEQAPLLDGCSGGVCVPEFGDALPPEDQDVWEPQVLYWALTVAAVKQDSE